MLDHEFRMCVYVQLAALSHQKGQPLPRDRFLLLAGVEAYLAAWPDVGSKCRELLLISNPRHQASWYVDLPEAMRQPGFQQMVAQHERHCPPERAEHLLQQLNVNPRGDDAETTVGESMLRLLSAIQLAPRDD